MYKDRRIAVVIPAHNEAPHVGGVVTGMPDYVDHILVIDDCSNDETLAIATATTDLRVTGWRSPANLGVGGATVLGYEKALEIGCDVAVKMDGDGQMPPEHLHL